MNSKTNKSDEMNPVVAGAVGAAVGAGIGIVASAAMKNDKTKEAVHNIVSSAKDQALEYVDNMSIQQGQKGGQTASSTGNKRGLGSDTMDPQKKREIQSEGGKASHGGQ